MKLQAEWTNDCSGKQDYDAELVTLSTRYWPSQYSQTFRHPDKIITDHPSALVGIYLCEESDPLIATEFYADTEAGVKCKVEEWAQAQFEKIERVIRAEFAAGAEEMK